MARKITIEEAKRRLREDGRGIRLIGGYTKMGAKAEFECSRGHRWHTMANYVVWAKNGCPQCHADRRSDVAKATMNRADVKEKHRASVSKPEHKAKMSALARAFHALPEVKARHRAAIKAALNHPDVKTRHRDATKTALARPEVRAKISARQKVAMNRPEVKAKTSAAAKANWARPEYRAKHSARMKEALAKPEVKAKWRENSGWYTPKHYRKLGHEVIWLYIVEFIFEGNPIQKVGITCDCKKRWSELNVGGVQIIHTESGSPEYICKREKEIIRASHGYYANLPKSFNGYTECFHRVIDPRNMF